MCMCGKWAELSEMSSGYSRIEEADLLLGHNFSIATISGYSSRRNPADQPEAGQRNNYTRLGTV